MISHNKHLVKHFCKTFLRNLLLIFLTKFVQLVRTNQLPHSPTPSLVYYISSTMSTIFYILFNKLFTLLFSLFSVPLCLALPLGLIRSPHTSSSLLLLDALQSAILIYYHFIPKEKRKQTVKPNNRQTSVLLQKVAISIVPQKL